MAVKAPCASPLKNAIKGDFSPSTAVRMNRLSAVRLLLQHGANVNVRMPDGCSPLNLTVTALKEAGITAITGKLWRTAA